MTKQWYPAGFDRVGKAEIDLEDADIRVVAVDATYTFSTAHDFLDDVAGSARVVTLGADLSNKSFSNGVWDADNYTFTGLAGTEDDIAGLIYYYHTGTESTSSLLYFDDDTFTATAAQAASTSDTTVYVDPLKHDIANGATLAFSGGTSATLTAGASAGDRSLTVSSLSAGIAAGETATATVSGTTFPLTPDGNNINVTIDAAGICSFSL